MRTATWRGALAALALTVGPALATADEPKPAAATVPAGQRAIIIVQTADGTQPQIVNGVVLSQAPSATPTEGSAAKRERNHPVWHCVCDAFHGPAYRMPVECSSCCAEATFVFGSCSAFFNQCNSPYSKEEKKSDRRAERSERNCNCGGK